MKEEEGTKKGKSNKLFWVVLLAVAVILLALWWTGNLGITSTAKGTYKSVFLTNNQVYFGKLSREKSQYPVLTDVFYLQVTRTLQPKDQTAPPATNINLVKLGGEIHGPEDKMIINRDHILFYEDLKADSQVVKAIEDFKKNKENQ